MAERNREYDRRYSAMRRRRFYTAFVADPESRREEFLRSVRVTDGCWLWTGWTNRGYGMWDRMLAHRASYRIFVGPVPEGLHLDHLCRVRACVNPRHLEPVTLAENNRRAAAVLNRLATPCRRGHSPEERRLRSGEMRCRPCDNEDKRMSKMRRRTTAGTGADAGAVARATRLAAPVPAAVGTRSTRTQVGVTR
jgi:hypothetical protein